VVVKRENILLLEGASNGYSAYAMHRSEEIYGTAAHVSCRFTKDVAKLAVMVKTNDLVFGNANGSGKPVAQLSIGKMVP
jgi:hypothetical protein